MEEKKAPEDLGNTGAVRAEHEPAGEELAQSSRSKVPAANVSERCEGRSTKTELD